MNPKSYLETTIPSYLTSRPSRDLVMAAHQQITREWWDTQRDAFDLFVSQMVLDEVSSGDPEAAAVKVLRFRLSVRLKNYWRGKNHVYRQHCGRSAASSRSLCEEIQL